MTTTSEKILSEMERMGRMKIKDLCAKIGWQYQKFRRRIKANDFSPEDLELIAKSMNAVYVASIHPAGIQYLKDKGEFIEISASDLRGDTRTIRTTEEYAQDYCRQCPMHPSDQCGYVTRQLQHKCDRLALFTEGYEAGIEEVRKALPE